MSLFRYRATDLTILFIIMAFIETVSLIVLKRVGSQFVLSVVVPIALIVFMRWNAFGLIHALAGGVIQALVVNWYNGTLNPEAFLKTATVYGIGYLCASAAMLLFIGGKDKVRQKWQLTVLYAVIAFVATCITRAIAATIFGESFFDILLVYAAREALDLIFTVIVLLVARRQNAFFTDQKEYFHSAKR